MRYPYKSTKRVSQYFEVYKNTLMEWNNSVNLTAIRDEDGIIYRHFVDSLMLLKAVDTFPLFLI